MTRLALTLALVVSLGACASSSEYRIAETGYPVLSRSQVQIYEGRQSLPVTVEYQILGHLRPTMSNERSSYGGVDPLITEARRLAARMGANGVLIVTAEDLAADARLQQAFSSETSFSRRQFIAIYVGPPPPGVARAAE